MTKTVTPIRSTTLANGVRVSTWAQPHLSRAHVGIGMRAGPRYETDDTWGLSHIVEHMVFRGTASHTDSHAVNVEADSWGGDLDASTWRDRIFFETRADPENVPDALALLGEMWLSPRLDGLEVEREVLREEFLDALDDGGQMIDVDTVAMANAFADSALGRSIEGTLAQLDRIERKHVERYWRSLVAGENLVVVAAGPVDHDDVVASTKRTFGDVESGAPPAAGTAAAGRRKSIREVRTDQSQTSLRLSFRTPGIGSTAEGARERLHTNFVSWILDDGPATRLPEIVDREGLAYEVWADVDDYLGAGIFDFGASVAHDRVGLVTDRLVREAMKLVREPCATGELDRAKQRLRRDFTDFKDDPESACDALFRAALRKIDFDPAARLTLAESVTAAEIQTAARTLFQRQSSYLTLVGRPTRGAVASATRAWERLP